MSARCARGGGLAARGDRSRVGRREGRAAEGPAGAADAGAGAAPARVRRDDVHGHAQGLRVLRRRAGHDALPRPGRRRRRPRPHRLRRRSQRLGPRNVSTRPPYPLPSPPRLRRLNRGYGNCR
jgi:hypothetical protein